MGILRLEYVLRIKARSYDLADLEALLQSEREREVAYFL